MMGPKIKSIKGLFGTMHHYDEQGNYLGYSQQGLFGATNHFDGSGSNIGYSMDSSLGGVSHYDICNKKIGYTIDTEIGESHFGSQGECGYSSDGLFGTTTSFADKSLFEVERSDSSEDFDW